MKKDLLKQYEKSVIDLSEWFLRTYYVDKEDKEYYDELDYFNLLDRLYGFWVGDEIGDILSIGDEFWSVDDIVNTYKYKPTQDQLFDWYWHRLDAQMGKDVINYNLKNFIQLKIK